MTSSDIWRKTPPTSSSGLPSSSVPAYSLPPVSSGSHSGTATGAASSNTNTVSTSSGTNVGLIVGITAGIVAAAGLVFVIVYFIVGFKSLLRSVWLIGFQRRSKRNDDDAAFDSDVFRRQSAMLADDPPVGGSTRGYGGGGFNPRPPTMIERHIANGTPVSSMHGSQNGYAAYPGDYGVQYNNSNGYQASGFQPGQIVNSPNPFYSAPYGESGPAPSSPYDSSFARHPSQAAYLSRAPSAAANGNLGAAPDSHYVDLSRSSVTPFQAAQYEEINHRLNSPTLGAVSEDGHEQSPFSDPAQGVSPPSRARVASKPPSLPEVSAGPMSPMHDEFRGTRAPDAPPAAYVASGGNKRPDTVYTLYDDEDAYGGI